MTISVFSPIVKTVSSSKSICKFVWAAVLITSPKKIFSLIFNSIFLFTTSAFPTTMPIVPTRSLARAKYDTEQQINK